MPAPHFFLLTDHHKVKTRSSSYTPSWQNLTLWFLCLSFSSWLQQCHTLHVLILHTSHFSPSFITSSFSVNPQTVGAPYTSLLDPLYFLPKYWYIRRAHQLCLQNTSRISPTSQTSILTQPPSSHSWATTSRLLPVSLHPPLSFSQYTSQRNPSKSDHIPPLLQTLPSHSEVIESFL